jgi:hypothetical protein
MDRAEAEYERQKEGLEAFSKEQMEYVPSWKARVDEFEAAHAELGAVAAATTVANPYEVKIKGAFSIFSRKVVKGLTTMAQVYQKHRSDSSSARKSRRRLRVVCPVFTTSCRANS